MFHQNARNGYTYNLLANYYKQDDNLKLVIIVYVNLASVTNLMKNFSIKHRVMNYQNK